LRSAHLNGANSQFECFSLTLDEGGCFVQMKGGGVS